MHVFLWFGFSKYLTDPILTSYLLIFFPQVHFPDVEKVDWVNKVQYEHTCFWFYGFLGHDVNDHPKLLNQVAVF